MLSARVSTRLDAFSRDFGLVLRLRILYDDCPPCVCCVEYLEWYTTVRRAGDYLQMLDSAGSIYLALINLP